MAERTTKYDDLIKSEEQKEEQKKKKQEKVNPFDKANNTLKGASTATAKKETETPPEPVSDTTSEKMEQVPETEEVAEESTATAKKNRKLSRSELTEVFADVPKRKAAMPKTYYMEEDNLIKLEKLAKSQKISVSKALNKLLSEFL